MGDPGQTPGLFLSPVAPRGSACRCVLPGQAGQRLGPGGAGSDVPGGCVACCQPCPAALSLSLSSCFPPMPPSGAA